VRTVQSTTRDVSGLGFFTALRFAPPVQNDTREDVADTPERTSRTRCHPELGGALKARSTAKDPDVVRTMQATIGDVSGRGFFTALRFAPPVQNDTPSCAIGHSFATV
jgi:hypothetical protein